MTSRFGERWERLSSTYWFLPSLLLVAALGLAFATLTLDDALGAKATERIWGMYGGGPEGARAVLSAIAGSMITVASVVFSITIVALTLAAQQLGPRLLRNFMRDRPTQLTLGVFVATFLYSLLVLRAVRGPDGAVAVPQISVTVGLLLALVSIAVLVYFIHHIATAVQPGHIVSRVGRDIDQTVDRLFPDEIGADQRDVGAPSPPADLPPGLATAAPFSWEGEPGYLRTVDERALVRLARARDGVVQLAARPGDHVLPRAPLAHFWPPGGLDDEAREQLAGAFAIGPQRSITGDALFVFNQLVVVAVRALSPSLNDPFTATLCIDRLGASLARLAGRRIPSATRYDAEGRPRVVAPPVTFVEVADNVIGRLRHYGAASPMVLERLLEMIGRLGPYVRRAQDRHALLTQADRIRAEALESLTAEWDRAGLMRRHEAVVAALGPADPADGRP